MMPLVPVHLSVGWVNLCYWIRMADPDGPEGPSRAWFFPGDSVELGPADARILRSKLAEVAGKSGREECDPADLLRDVPPKPADTAE
jgi:hypothetical protein